MNRSLSCAGFSMVVLVAALFFIGCASPETTGDSAAAPSHEASSPSPHPWFTDVTEELGISFRYLSGSEGRYFMPEIMGGGGALFDADNDGDLDLYLVNGGFRGRSREANPAPNRFFRQEADGAFVEVGEEAGLADAGYGMGCVVGDIDNDGDSDIYVTNFGPDVLYQNNGDGSFTDITRQAGVTGRGWSTSGSFLDFDRDGFLDLYVASYVNYSPPKACSDPSGHPEYCGPDSFQGVPDILLRNRGDGTFEDVSRSSAIGLATGKGLGVIVADYNEDGRPDVYVANDGQENHLWINQGDGSFENQAMIRGAAFNIFAKTEASMGVVTGDLDLDGDLDLFMTHLDRESNTLYMNMGGGQFEDRTAGSGLGLPSLNSTGFGALLLDADHDGDLDLFVANGRVRRKKDAAVPAPGPSGVPKPVYAERNLFFENDGTGRFQDASGNAGPLTGSVEISRGAMMGDIDRDGDLDVVVVNIDGPVQVLRNDAPKVGGWIAINCYDPDLNRPALGAVVRFEIDGRPRIATVSRAFSYASSSPPLLRFGLGKAQRIARFEVDWPDGSREEFPGSEGDRLVELVKGRGTSR